MKRCTYCGKDYPDDVSTCAVDGEPLEKFPPDPEPTEPVKEERLVTVEIFPTHEAAELAAAKLRAFGVSCGLKSDDAGGMYPNLTLAGGIRLQVRAPDVEAAAALLKAQLSAAEMSELDVKAAAASTPEDRSKNRFAPVQILLGISVGILLTLLARQIQRSGTSTYNSYSHGKIYEQWSYRNGYLTEEKKDRNLDGNWDYWAYYNHGRAVRSEADNNFDGKPDAWWRYSNGSPVSFEKDSDFNGIPDEFCRYSNGILQQMDVSPNGQGFVSQRWIFRNDVLTEIWSGGDSNGVFKKIVTYDPFVNPTNTQFGEFPN